jgi:5-methylcytosine-specific restriction endonuclease McrA
MTDKRCPRCGETKPLGDFVVSRGYCRPCSRAYDRAWHAANQDRDRADQRRWRENGGAAAIRAWRVANRERANAVDRIAQQRRDAIKRGVFVEDVQLDVLFVRDCGTCQLCRKPVVERSGQMGPSIDHVIPLSKGGEHSYANTQLSHLLCNSQKGDRSGPHP